MKEFDQVYEGSRMKATGMAAAVISICCSTNSSSWCSVPDASGCSAQLLPACCALAMPLNTLPAAAAAAAAASVLLQKTKHIRRRAEVAAKAGLVVQEVGASSSASIRDDLRQMAQEW
jgi:hypothetical protein